MRWIWILIGALCIALLAVCIISIIENRRLIVTHYTVCKAKIPAEFDGKKMVVLADLHNAGFGVDNALLLQKIREEHPDYIVIAGDMIIAAPHSDIHVPVKLIHELAGICPVYYAKGNHEMRAALEPEVYGTLWEEYQAAIQDCVYWLDNETVELTPQPDRGETSERKSGVRLTGLDTAAEYYKRFRRTPMKVSYLKDVLGDCDPDFYQILIAHHPAYFPAYAEWGADLVISGHLHGGMVRLPVLGGMISPMIQFFPKYDRGRFEEGSSTMLLSGGLGNHTFKFRVNNLPELLSVEFRRDANAVTDSSHFR